MRKISKTNLLALLAIAGVGNAYAANLDSTNNEKPSSLSAEEHVGLTRLGTESACGKGSCGKDEKGAKEAAQKHKSAKKPKLEKSEVKDKADKTPEPESDNK